MKILKNKKIQKGAAMVEYGILVALISVVAIVAVQGIGDAVDDGFVDVCNTLNEAAAIDSECVEA